jgi:subtilisin family serine protease
MISALMNCRYALGCLFASTAAGRARRYALSSLLMILGFWGGWLAAVPALAWQTPATVQREAQFERLLAGARAHGSVRVIVEFDTPPVPALAEAERSERFAAVREWLIARLAAFRPSVLKRFRLLPLLAARLGPEAVAFLRTLPAVRAVYEDAAVRPTVAASQALPGSSAVATAGFTGADWTVAVLDTGVDRAHPFLSGKVVSEACYSTTDPEQGYTSTCPGASESSLAPGSAEPCVAAAGCDHGTHVAGIAVGRGPDFSGVARDASLIAMQVFTYSEGGLVALYSDLLLGLERVYALRNDFKIAAVNMSLGGGQFSAPCDSNPLKPAIDLLSSAGIATVIASGNDASSGALSAPACISTAVSVGASTVTDTVASFSNSAKFLTLLAPGENITSAIPGGAYIENTGTSMAAPHVVGAWALMKQQDPGASVARIRDALVRTGRPLTDTRNGLTKPRLQIDAALGVVAVAPEAERAGN